MDRFCAKWYNSWKPGDEIGKSSAPGGLVGRKSFLASWFVLAAVLAASNLPGQQNSIGRGDRDGPIRQPGGGNADGPAEQVWSERAGEMRHRRMSRPMLLTGKVATEDGSPIPEAIVVELACHASVRQQVQTFKGGQFSFDLGSHSSAEFLDASVGRNDANNVNPFARVPGSEYTPGGEQVDLSGCEVRANLPGFASDRIQLGLRKAMDRPDIGTIVLKRREGVAGSTVSFTALAAPKKARKAFEKAEKELRKEKRNMERVQKELMKAVQVYPQYATAWNLLGMIRMADRDVDGARQAFEASIEADENYIRPYLSLVDMEIRAGAWARISELCGKVVELNPFMVRCQYFHALASLNLGRMEAAEASAIKVQESQDARFLSGSHYIRGAVLARKGDFESAAQQFRQFLKIVPEGRGAIQIKENLVAWERQGLIQPHNPTPTQAGRTVQ